MSVATHPSGYALDTDRDRLDLDRIERWLAAESYWAAGRPRDNIARSLDNSVTYGLYAPSGEQAGLFRVVTDHATFAWFCDFYVDKQHRGQGLAKWAVAVIRDELVAYGVYRIILATADAHGLYAGAGFGPMVDPEQLHAVQRAEAGRGLSVADPDGLERLWTPWRMGYVSGPDKPTGCPFCVAPRDDPDQLMVARGELVYAMLNRFPYNPGHLLICPYRHVADYTELSDDEAVELARFTQTAMRVVREVSAAHGFNIGMNQGGAAGAGIAAHLHQHVVPRWGGDANFLPVIGRTKALPQLLADTRDLLAGAWPSADS